MQPRREPLSLKPQEEKNSLRWAWGLVQELHEGHFYGKLTLNFENGNVVIVRREETIKPPKD